MGDGQTVTRRELEETNQQLQELIRDLQGENAQLKLSLKLACRQIEQLTAQLESTGQRFTKLLNYVKSLRAWASAAGRNRTWPQTAAGDGR